MRPLTNINLIVLTSIIVAIGFTQIAYPEGNFNNNISQHNQNITLSEDGSLLCMKSSVDNNHFVQPADITDWSYGINAPMLASLRIADVDNNGILDIICATYGQQPNPYSSGIITVLDIDGGIMPGWPFEANAPFSATPAVGDIDNDGDQEIIAGDWNTLHLFNHDGSYYPGWPISNGIYYSPVLEDLDGDNDLEIIYSMGSAVYVRHHNGTLFDGSPYYADTLVGEPAVADIDNDGEMEIIAGTYYPAINPLSYKIYVWNLDGTILPGFPFQTSGVVKSTPAIGDVDNDGFLEIVVAAYDESNYDYIYCVDYTGSLKPGWPVQAQYCRLSSTALGDIDGDGDLEIFIGGLKTQPEWVEILYGYDHEGQFLDNWPVELPHDGACGNIRSSPVIAEVDGDTSSPEIFIKTFHNIFGLNSDGSYVDDFPYYLSDGNQSGTYSPAPAIGDMDFDGDADFIFASSFGDIAYVDSPDDYNPSLSCWPMFKHDQYGTGRYGYREQSYIETSCRLPEKFGLNQNYPNPFNPSTMLSYSLTKPVYAALSIYNILGQRVETLVESNHQAGEYNIKWDASEMPSGIYFARLEAGDFSNCVRMVLVK